MADDAAGITKEHVVELVRVILRNKGWSAARLAREIGVAPSTITRALDPEVQFLPSARTLNKLVAIVRLVRMDLVDTKLDIYSGMQGDLQKTGAMRGAAPLVGEIRSGAWYDDSQLKVGFTSVDWVHVADSEYKGQELSAYRVVGSDTDQEYDHGTIVIVAPAPVLYEGDVVVLRRRVDTFLESLFETALWSVATDEAGPLLTSRAKIREPEMPAVDERVWSLSAEILGVVVSSYTRRPRETSRPIETSRLRARIAPSRREKTP